MALNLDTSEKYDIGPHLSLPDSSGISEQTFTAAVNACARLRFRIGIAINSFRVADWYDSLGRHGMHFSAAEIDGYRFPSHDMTEVEKLEFVQRGIDRRQETRQSIAKYIDPDAINLLEYSASVRATDSFNLACELMNTVEHVFDAAYQRLVISSIEANEEIARVPPQGIPELRWIMQRSCESFPVWQSGYSKTAELERVQ